MNTHDDTGAVARSREIVDAWDGWQDELDRLYEEIMADADLRESDLRSQVHELTDRITDLSATTMEGMLVKARVADRRCNHAAAFGLVGDLLRMAGINVLKPSKGRTVSLERVVYS